MWCTKVAWSAKRNFERSYKILWETQPRAMLGLRSGCKVRFKLSNSVLTQTWPPGLIKLYVLSHFAIFCQGFFEILMFALPNFCTECEVKAIVACEQALRGSLWRGREKDSLQLRLCNLNICIEFFDAKCWLAEMTLVMTSLPSAHVAWRGENKMASRVLKGARQKLSEYAKFP